MTDRLKPDTYSLRAIYLMDCSARIAPGFDPTQPGIHLTAQYRVVGGEAECRVHEINLDDGSQINMRTCVFTTQFEFRYVRQSDLENAADATPVATITARIANDYQCNTQEFPAEDDLSKWGNTNVMLHAWPYWREFCHNTLARMHLPITVMPLVAIGPADPSAEAPKKTRGNAARKKRETLPSP